MHWLGLGVGVGVGVGIGEGLGVGLGVGVGLTVGGIALTLTWLALTRPVRSEYVPSSHGNGAPVPSGQ